MTDSAETPSPEYNSQLAQQLQEPWSENKTSVEDYVPLRELSKPERQELAAYIELVYWRNGSIPTAAQLRSEIPHCKITDGAYASYMNDPDLIKYLQNERAIPIEAEAKLTTKQLDWIRVLTDAADMRPLAKKLAELNLTKSEVNRWLTNPFYREVLAERCDAGFGDSRTSVMKALQVEAMSGNITAIKMYLEMTGDYQPGMQFNVVVEQRAVITNVVAILQELVPREVLLEVVERLETATVPNHPALNAAKPLPPMSARTTAIQEKHRSTEPTRPRAEVIDVHSFTNEGWG